MSEHQHHHDNAATAHTAHASGGHAELELEITSYFMGSNCPHIEAHVTATPGVHSVNLNRNSGIILVGYDPGQVTPDAIIEAVKHCGFLCQEGGPVHTVSHAGHGMADEHAGHDEHAGCKMGIGERGLDRILEDDVGDTGRNQRERNEGDDLQVLVCVVTLAEPGRRRDGRQAGLQ